MSTRSKKFNLLTCFFQAQPRICMIDRDPVFSMHFEGWRIDV